jgi:DNA-nicking Smr family endonuclease
MRAQQAVSFLDARLQAFKRQGEREVLVIHGRGHSSVGGIPILKKLVAQWCETHPSLVRSFGRAPRVWGGEGATLIQLWGERKP